MRRMLVLAGVTALAGCGPPLVWQHRSFGTPPTQAEVDECRRDAYLEANRQAFYYDFAWPRYYGWSGWYGWPGWYGYDPFYRYGPYDPYLLEQDLYRFCLRARGYHLVPARPADEAAKDGRTTRESP